MGAEVCTKCVTKAEEEAPTEKVKVVNPKHYFTHDEIVENFEKVDTDGSGCIDLGELAELLEIMGVQFTSTTIKDIYCVFDMDHDGQVTLEEFAIFFEGKDKRKGLKYLLKAAIKTEQKLRLEARKQKVDDKPIDVFLIHGSEDASNLRSWWLACVLEFTDLRCYGDYVWNPREGDAIAENVAPTENFTITDAHMCVIMLDKRSKNPQRVANLLKDAKPEMPISVFIETDRGRKDVVAEWQRVIPTAFKQTPSPVSRHYVSDSEQIVLNTVFPAMAIEVPILTVVRPPGSDLDDFSTLEAPGVKFIKAEYVMVIKPGDAQLDLPLEAFEQPGCRRPVYVSYPREDPSIAGPTATQLQEARDLLRKLRMGERVFFLDQCSLSDGNLFGGLDVQDCLTLCRFIVLDKVDKDAVDSRPFLERGNNFFEVMMCLLTGNLAPRDKTQFVELDNAVGNEFAAGMNFRRYVRENRNRMPNLVDELCAHLKSKTFQKDGDRVRAEEILRSSLERHPILQEDLPTPEPAPMTTRSHGGPRSARGKSKERH